MPESHHRCRDCGTPWTVDEFECCGPCISCGSNEASIRQDAEEVPDAFH